MLERVLAASWPHPQIAMPVEHPLVATIRSVSFFAFSPTGAEW
jgi:hypothetical protein